MEATRTEISKRVIGGVFERVMPILEDEMYHQGISTETHQTLRLVKAQLFGLQEKLMADPDVLVRDEGEDD